MLDGLRLAGNLAAEGENAAEAAYLVGGSVRDALLGRTPVDPDISVVGDAPTFAASFAEKGGGEVEAVSQFGTARVALPGGRFDLAMCRTETYAEPGALPTVTSAGILEDLSRRDFTINAMAVRSSTTQVSKTTPPESSALSVTKCGSDSSLIPAPCCS